MNRFIVVEGSDLVGKSTIARSLASRLGFIYYATPPAPFSEIRNRVEEGKNLVERYLFYVTSVVRASAEIHGLLGHSGVVCDRYIYSTLAYHLALGVDVGMVNIAYLNLVVPDVILLLKLRSQDEYMNRLKNKVPHIYDKEIEGSYQLQTKIGDFYEEVIKRESSIISIINVDGLSRDAVLDRCFEAADLE